MSLMPKVLVVDDEPKICDSLKILLSSLDYAVDTAGSGHLALDLLSGAKFDVALVDVVIPDIDGYSLMEHIKAHHPEMMVITITGNADYETAVGALRRGAYDFLKKPINPEELLHTVQNALTHKELKLRNEKINFELELSENRYRHLVQNSPDIIYTLDARGRFTFISEAVERLLGFNRDTLIGMPYDSIVADSDRSRARLQFNERRTGNRAVQGLELKLKRINIESQNGEPVNDELVFELKATGIYEQKDGKFLGTHGVLRDISERKWLDEKIQQAQRMKALGALSGGIAHDFNNLLMGIQGNISLMLMDLEAGDPNYDKLENIQKYIHSGSELTRQLLGFARGEKNQTRSIDINYLIKNSATMFGRTNKDVHIQLNLEKKIPAVDVDTSQFEQVLLNLFVNAKQAMSGGGSLYINTECLTISSRYYQLKELVPGRYIKISITDTGIGMDPGTKAKVFDPFFTTKSASNGIGLGLASTYGIIKNHNGFIYVYSEVEQGTTFNIYLPVTGEAIYEEADLQSEISYGSGTVLLVDDEKTIIDVGRRMIEKIGYRVLAASSGEQAIELFEQHHVQIDIIILDMVMSKMNGEQVFYRLREIEPHAKILLTSGYSANDRTTDILARGCNGFIQKPFDLIKLSRKIMEVKSDPRRDRRGAQIIPYNRGLDRA